MDGRPRDESYDALLARAVGRTIKVLRADQAIERNELAERVGRSRTARSRHRARYCA
jgi:predicted transcriptional regulator